MRKAGAFFLILLFSFSLLYAQEDDSPSTDDEWDYYAPDMYTSGDQTFIISLGTVFPTIFLNNGKKITSNFSPPVGGAGSLSYNYYLTPKVFLGGEVSGVFMPTLGNNMFYAIPLGVRTGYQFSYWRLEFPVTLTVGMVWQRYLNYSYYGLYMKGGGAAYYRFSTEWSFGITTNWYWLPQWTDDRSKNVDGNMIDVLLSARYHF
ncbi:MAG: hypothetical protein LBI04_02875 [Treponema sp.]|jgi:hypothetical protein|nr:hypothetical protein [Treponema sp.]